MASTDKGSVPRLLTTVSAASPGQSVLQSLFSVKCPCPPPPAQGPGPGPVGDQRSLRCLRDASGQFEQLYLHFEYLFLIFSLVEIIFVCF